MSSPRNLLDCSLLSHEMMQEGRNVDDIFFSALGEDYFE